MLDAALAAAVAVIAFGVYAATCCPTVSSEDSGELIAAAYFFGVPHPPGYPLWTMLCGVFIRVFAWGQIAWRANVFSGACAAACVAVLFRCLRCLGVGCAAAAGAALSVAFGAVFWSQSVITEVYSLHALLIVGAVACVLQWRDSQRQRPLLLAALLLGLGMSNHHLAAFSAVGLAAWVIFMSPRVLLDLRLVSACVGFFFLGLAPYAYLWVRAQADPPINWGETKTFAALVDHVGRQQYKSRPDETAAAPGKSLGQSAREWRIIGQYVLREHTPLLAAVAVLGVAVMAWRHREAASLWGLLTLAHLGLYTLLLQIGEDRSSLWSCKVFFVAQYAIMALPLGFGAEFLLATARRWAASSSGFLRERRVSSVISAAGAGMFLLPLVRYWPENNYRHYWYAYDHAQNILNSLLPNAILFPTGDHNTFPLLYLTLVERERPDVTLADKYGYIDLALYADMPELGGRKPRTPEERNQIEEWIIRHARRPVYYTVKRDSLVSNAEALPVGLTYHLLPESKTLDEETPWTRIGYRNLRADQRAPRDYGADNILSDYEFFCGVRSLRQADETQALEHFAAAMGYGWGVKEIANNIGSALAENGLTQQALAYFRRASELDPRYATARWNEARVRKALRDWAGAESVFLELAELTPMDFRVFGELGFLGQLLDRPKEVVEPRFTRSLELNAQQPQILAALGQLHAPVPETLSLVSTAAAPADGAAVATAASVDPVVTAPEPAPSVARVLAFDEVTWDAGEMAPSEVREHRFSFRCVADRPLRITGLQTSCGCLAATLADDQLDPGEHGEVLATLTASRKPGREIAQSISVSTDLGNQPAARLTVKGRTLPEFMIDPPRLSLEAEEDGEASRARLLIRRASGEAFSVIEVGAPHSCIRVQSETDGLQAVHAFDIEFDPARAERTLDGTITLTTDVAGTERIEVPVQARRIPVLSATPAIVHMGTVHPGREARAEVQLVSTRPLDLALLPTDAPDEFSAELQQDAQDSKRWWLNVVFSSVGKSCRPYFQMLAIASARGEGPKVEVPVYVVLEEPRGR